jgi:hypothetical protein
MPQGMRAVAVENLSEAVVFSFYSEFPQQITLFTFLQVYESRQRLQTYANHPPAGLFGYSNAKKVKKSQNSIVPQRVLPSAAQENIRYFSL